MLDTLSVDGPPAWSVLVRQSSGAQTGTVYFDPSRSAADLPTPPTPDEVAREFPVPLLTLVEQESVEEAWIGTVAQNQGGQRVLDVAALSYTLWRNPHDRDDPVNLAELSEATRAALDAEPIVPLPDRLLRIRERMRYPSLWEAVRTTHVELRELPWHTPEYALVDHVNYVVMNTFRDERVRGGFPGELEGAATEKAIEHDIPISLDGVNVPGMRIDTDPHVLALGIDLGDRVLTAVFAREFLPYLRLAFVTREL